MKNVSSTMNITGFVISRGGFILMIESRIVLVEVRLLGKCSEVGRGIFEVILLEPVHSFLEKF